MTVPELNGLPFIAANIERIMGRLESPSALPDFFLPFEDDVIPPIVQVWREELPALMEDYRRFTGYISAIRDPWTRRVFELRFLSRKSFREIGLEYGILSGTLKQEVYSYLNRNPEGYISCRELAEAWGVDSDTIGNYCRRGRLPGAMKRKGYGSDGNQVWMIPASVQRPPGLQPIEKGYVTGRELAELWGVSLQAIHQYCRRGLLPGAYKRPFSCGPHQWVIPADVDRPKRKQTEAESAFPPPSP